MSEDYALCGSRRQGSFRVGRSFEVPLHITTRVTADVAIGRTEFAEEQPGGQRGLAGIFADVGEVPSPRMVSHSNAFTCGVSTRPQFESHGKVRDLLSPLQRIFGGWGLRRRLGSPRAFGIWIVHAFDQRNGGRTHFVSMTIFQTYAPVLAYWTHNWSPFLIRFSENFGIRYYGLSYLLGFVAGAGLLHLYARAGRSQLPAEKISDLIIALVLGVMIGGRLGSFLLYHPEQLIEDPLSFFRVWEGGMASHGGMIGVAVALAWFSRSQKIPFLHLSDLIVSVGPAGLFFGRIANFINGELWGKPAVVRWAVIFPESPHPLVPRHPSQLYEAVLEGALLFAFMQWRFWRSSVTRETPGRLTGEFLIAYAIVRAIGETFREPDAALIAGLSRGTFYSIFLVAAGVAFFVWSKRTRKQA